MRPIILRISLIASSLVIAVLLRPTVVAAATTLTACQNITQSGSYILGSNVTAPEGDTCFSIRTGNVTFDGNGKTITSTSYAVDVADYQGTGFHTIVVKNFIATDSVRTFGDHVHHVTFEHLNVKAVDVLGSDDVTVNNNIVGQGGIHINIADRAAWSVYRPIITHNTITGGSTEIKILLEINGGRNHPCPMTNAVATYNTINNSRNDPPPEATASVRFICAAGTTFQHNSITATGTTIGLYMRDEADDGLITDNVFHVTHQEAIRVSSGNVDKTFPARNIFERNIFHSTNGPAIFFQGIGSNNRFVNNVFWGEDTGMILGAEGNIFDHNTFYSTGANNAVHILGYGHGPVDTWTNNIFSYAGTSVYGFDGFAVDRYIGRHNLFCNRNGAVRIGQRTLAEWKSYLNNGEVNSLEANPLFVDPANGDFRLQAGSPARLAGSDGSNLGYAANALIPVPDITRPKPTAAIVYPRAGSTVGGRILITSNVKNVAGTGGLTGAVFTIDGVQFATDPNAPFRAWLDTRPLKNGYHRIEMTVTTRNGGTTTVFRGFTIRNGFSIVGMTLNGKTTVSGIATLKPKHIYGSTGNLTVRLRRSNGEFIAQSTSTPYLVQWDTRGLRNGWYRLVMNVTDATTNKTVKTYVWVNVKN